MAAERAADRPTSGRARGQIDLDGAGAALWQLRRGRLWRFAGLTVLALLVTGVAVCQLADRLGWHAPASIVDKLWLLRQQPESTVLFVGTSQMYYGIDPAVVDAGLAEAGCQERSLNLASPAATLAEMAKLVDAIDEALPPGRLVVVTPTGFPGPPLKKRYPFDRRHATRLAYLPFELAAAETRHSPADRWLRFLFVSLEDELGVHRLYTELFRTPAPGRERDELARRRGFVPLTESPKFTRLRERFLKRYLEFAAPQAIDALILALQEVDPTRATSALAIARRVEAGGNRVVLLAMPSEEVLGGQAARNALLARPDLAVIDLSIDRGLLPYPDRDYFFDQGHLTLRGAELASHEVGRQLCRLIQAGS